MNYYRYDHRILFSEAVYEDLQHVTESEASLSEERFFWLHSRDPKASRRSFCLSDASLAGIPDEGLALLRKMDGPYLFPQWIMERIEQKKVTAVNTAYPDWLDALDFHVPARCRIHVVGLGDVGGIMLTGLRLLGDASVSAIGIYDIDQNKVLRWCYEANQILSPVELPAESRYPEVVAIDDSSLFDCDLFVFCVTAGVPALDDQTRDVRLAQFESNARIIGGYARKARERRFKGIFAVVSDPVDLLCKAAFAAANTDENGQWDMQGLAAEQIRGYGLGVMHARAAFFAGQSPDTRQYLHEGRAFGPHGEGLVIADSVSNYNEAASLLLTEKTKHANMEVRAAGFKPYIAPAISSACLSLLATIRGQWHYSATYMGGVFMGARNRLLPAGVELERLDIPPALFSRLENTYESLAKMI